MAFGQFINALDKKKNYLPISSHNTGLSSHKQMFNALDIVSP